MNGANMTAKEAIAEVKTKYPRAICRTYGIQFAIQSYRCGEPITHHPVNGSFIFPRIRREVFDTQREAWIAAAIAIREELDGDLPR